MGILSRTLILAAALTVGATSASAGVLNFDDLTGQAVMPATYNCFDFSGWTHYDWVQAPYTASSGNTRLYNLSDANSISAASDFIFTGSSVSGYGTVNGSSYGAFHYELYNDNVLVHVSTAIDLDGSGVPAWYASGYAGLIDEVRVIGNNDFFVLDDFTYEGDLKCVPEPVTMALLGLGGAAALIARKRRSA